VPADKYVVSGARRVQARVPRRFELVGRGRGASDARSTRSATSASRKRVAARTLKGELLGKALAIAVGLPQTRVATLEAGTARMGVRGARELKTCDPAIGTRVALSRVGNTLLQIQ
jgi:hypothetical protein